MVSFTSYFLKIFMRKICIFIFIFSFFVKSYAYQEYIQKEIWWKSVNLIKVILDWKHKIVTSLSQDWDTLDNLIKKENWISWVNWSYFCPADYKVCNWINFTDRARIYNNTLYSKWWTDFWSSWMFWFWSDWTPIFVLKNDWYSPWINKKVNTNKISEISYWLANYPVLVLNWENIVSQSDDILDTKMKTIWTKSFICSQSDNKTIYMWMIQNMTVKEMASYIKENLWCYNAINLDSWWSLWMTYNNEKIKVPWRKIMDAFVVVEVKNEIWTTTLNNNLESSNSQKTNSQIKYELLLKKYSGKIDILAKEDINKVIILKNKLKNIRVKLNTKSKNYKLIYDLEKYCDKKIANL